MVLNVVFIVIATFLTLGVKYLENRFFNYSFANNRYQRALSYLLLGFGMLTGVRMLNIYFLSALLGVKVDSAIDDATLIGFGIYSISVVLLFLRETQLDKKLDASYVSGSSDAGVALGYLYAKHKDVAMDDTIDTLDHLNDLNSSKIGHMDYTKNVEIEDLGIEDVIDLDVLDVFGGLS